MNPRDPDTDDLVVHFWRGSGGAQDLTYPATALFITSKIDWNAALNADDSVLCIHYGSDGAIFQDIPAADVRH